MNEIIGSNNKIFTQENQITDSQGNPLSSKDDNVIVGTDGKPISAENTMLPSDTKIIIPSNDKK